MNTDNWLERTELLLGKEKLDLLRKAHVLVVGLGGVGAYAAEMIVRATSTASWSPSTRPSAARKPRFWPNACATSTRR